MRKIFFGIIGMISIVFPAFAQQVLYTNKLIINTESKSYFYIDSSGGLIIKEQNARYEFKSEYYKSYSKKYYFNIYNWDIADSNIIYVNILQDFTGTPISQARFNAINKLKSLKKSDIINYQISKNALISNSLPIFPYMMRMEFEENLLKGPLYFDLKTSKDSLYLFVYLDDNKTIEIWNYLDYHLIKKNLNFDQRERQRSENPWFRTASVPANIITPFRVVHTRGRDYLITTAGDILRIGTKALEPAGKLPSLPGKGILVIDKGKDAVYFMEEKWLAETEKRPIEEIISKEAVRILKEE